MATVKSIKELEVLLNKKINSALRNEVEKVARKTLKENVVTEVYDAYNSQYQRTGELLQDRNIESKMEDENTLSIHSTRHEGSRDIAEVIEYGKGYNPAYLDEVIEERPFHAETAKELEEKGLAKKALADGLKRQGLDVK